MIRPLVAKWRKWYNALTVLNVNTKKVFTYLRRLVGTGHLLEPKIISLGIFSNSNSASLIISFLMWKPCGGCIYFSVAPLLLIDAQWNWSLRVIWIGIRNLALSYCCRGFFVGQMEQNLNICWEEKSATSTEGKIVIPHWDITFVFWSAVQLPDNLHNEKGSAWACMTLHSARHAFKFSFVRHFLSNKNWFSSASDISWCYFFH